MSQTKTFNEFLAAEFISYLQLQSQLPEPNYLQLFNEAPCPDELKEEVFNRQYDLPVDAELDAVIGWGWANANQVFNYVLKKKGKTTELNDWLATAVKNYSGNLFKQLNADSQTNKEQRKQCFLSLSERLAKLMSEQADLDIAAKQQESVENPAAQQAIKLLQQKKTALQYMTAAKIKQLEDNNAFKQITLLKQELEGAISKLTELVAQTTLPTVQQKLTQLKMSCNTIILKISQGIDEYQIYQEQGMPEPTAMPVSIFTEQLKVFDTSMQAALADPILAAQLDQLQQIDAKFVKFKP